MTYHYDATGERIENDIAPDTNVSPVTGRDPEIVARCNELRRILRESRARRQTTP